MKLGKHGVAQLRGRVPRMRFSLETGDSRSRSARTSAGSLLDLNDSEGGFWVIRSDQSRITVRVPSLPLPRLSATLRELRSGLSAASPPPPVAAVVPQRVPARREPAPVKTAAAEREDLPPKPEPEIPRTDPFKDTRVEAQAEPEPRETEIQPRKTEVQFPEVPVQLGLPREYP
jgi:hypothetical protein